MSAGTDTTVTAEPQPVWNATIPGSACLGPDYESNYEIVGQEDCLYLNVYTPKWCTYMISSFISGQGISYGPQYLLDINDFVYVSINCRLGILGFASTGDSILPENNGMKDQVAALKWIQQNIVLFGGNPNSITITGLSAGASSCFAIESFIWVSSFWYYTDACIQVFKYQNKILNKRLSKKKEFSNNFKTFLNHHFPLMISDRTFGYAVSKAAQYIASKNTAAAYFHEFGYSGNYSVISSFDPKSYYRGSSSYLQFVINNVSFTFYIAPGIGNSEIWLPVSKNLSDPFRFVKITQQQTFEAKEQSNHRNYAF
ncbi:hypothetical protein QTP88_009866 [Uroleucon formosanum]